MIYRNRSPRCRHGFARELVKCPKCDGEYSAGRSQRPEPKPPKARWRAWSGKRLDGRAP